MKRRLCGWFGLIALAFVISSACYSRAAAACPNGCKVLYFYNYFGSYWCSSPHALGSSTFAQSGIQQFPRIPMGDTFDLYTVSPASNDTCPGDGYPQEANPQLVYTKRLDTQGIDRYKCTPNSGT